MKDNSSIIAHVKRQDAVNNNVTSCPPSKEKGSLFSRLFGKKPKPDIHKRYRRLGNQEEVTLALSTDRSHLWLHRSVFCLHRFCCFCSGATSANGALGHVTSSCEELCGSESWSSSECCNLKKPLCQHQKSKFL